MTPDNVIEWRKQADAYAKSQTSDSYDMKQIADTRFAQLATEAERKSRQAAQIENEGLKARIARFGMEQAIAVNKARKDERERCLNAIRDICEGYRRTSKGLAAEKFGDNCEAAIRALKD